MDSKTLWHKGLLQCTRGNGQTALLVTDMTARNYSFL